MTHSGGWRNSYRASLMGHLSSLKFLRFSFSRFQRLLRADSFGGPASSTSQRLPSSYWLAVYKKCRTSFDQLDLRPRLLRRGAPTRRASALVRRTQALLIFCARDFAIAPQSLFHAFQASVLVPPFPYADKISLQILLWILKLLR